MEKIINIKNKVFDFIYKYRYIIAILIIAICVLFKLHGSSIGLWNSLFNTGIDDTSLILGRQRGIRSDEWAVTTPFIFSQKYNDFKFYSDILRGGTTTDTFSLYGLPAANILEIFRPFHIGYMILGLERGLSFFWIARFVALFLISFELFMILFNKDKRVSLIGGFIITFSPLVQWIFATNGVAELFIFGGLALIMLYKYLNAENFKIKLLCLLVALISAGGYVLILYPAFQIAMFWVFLVLAIYIIATNYKNTKITKKDIISIIITLLIFVSLMVYFYNMSKDTINITLNTIYPGSRVETGGGEFRKYITYIDNVLLPYKEIGTVNNAKEIITHPVKESTMFSLFPLGIIFAIYTMIKNKKADLFTCILLVPYLIIGIFCFIEVPEWFAKITLLSYSTAQKAKIACGFIDVIFLLRFLSSERKEQKLWVSICLAFILSFGLVLACRILNPDYVGKLLAIFLFIMCMYLFFFALRFNTKYGKVLFTIGIVGTMLIAGGLVNPISSGLDVIYDSPILKAAEKINEDERGIWLSDAMGFPLPNYLTMVGCESINATNIYPNLDLWKSLDVENKYEEVYNRYAHVIMEVKNEDEIINKFVLLDLDKIQVYITPDELENLNIKYIFTVRVMEDFENDNVSFDLIYNENSYHIYKVEYK